MKKLYYLYILDRSGSMSSVRQQTIEGLNGQIETMKQSAKSNKLDCSVTLMLFDQNGPKESWFDYIFVNKSAKDCKKITEQDYAPRGGTPLRDAIGHGVQKLQETLGNHIANEDVNILVTIFTDGHENASVDFDDLKIKKMIKHLSEDGKWTFTFMGAGGIDEVQNVAKNYSIDLSNVMAYDNTEAGHLGATSCLRSSTKLYMANLAENKDVTKSFFEEKK